MTISRRTLLGTATAAAALPLVRPRAQGAPTVKIGVLNDMSGPYLNTGGPTSVICCKQALEDFGVSGKGLNVEVINADHQNKPDLAVSIARQWFDRDGVDMILDVPTSSVALAVQGVTREKNKVFLASGAGDVGADRRAVLAQLRALDLRHLHAGEIDRRRDGEGGRRLLVLPHRRLRVRQAAAGRHHRASCRAAGGKVLGSSPYPFPGTIRLLVVPGAGAVEPRQGAGPVQCRRRYGELDQAGPRVRREPDDEAGGAADVRHRRARAGTRRVAGAEPDRELLLGPE